jgi:hypothetical protein
MVYGWSYQFSIELSKIKYIIVKLWLNKNIENTTLENSMFDGGIICQE